MNPAKASIILMALVASIALVQAAGGIKGQRSEESQQRISGIKGPRQQNTYTAPAPQPIAAPQIQRPVIAAPVKGPGPVTPVFTTARIQPVVQQVRQEPEPEQQQIQQQEAEIDPNPAAQDNAPAIAIPAAAAPAEAEEANPRPEPYAFQYAFDAGDSVSSGSSQREEQQDANGRVTGFYTLMGSDGRQRRVTYVADAAGFRAEISTNELGTQPAQAPQGPQVAQSPADVEWQAQAPSDAQLRQAEAATQIARQRALENPQSLAQAPIAASAAAASNTFSKVSSPRQIAAASSKGQQQIIAAPEISQQLQEPFEQIRQTELSNRARKSRRHAPFYLYTV